MRAEVGDIGRGKLLGSGSAQGLTGELPEIQSPSPLMPHPQTDTKVELYEMHDPVPLIVGSSVGGLVLLALITAGLYKVFPCGLLLARSPPYSLLLTLLLITGFDSQCCQLCGLGQVTELQL